MSEELEQAIKTLIKGCSTLGSNGVVAEALDKIISKEHRTIQQSVMRELHEFICNYRHTAFDLRNQASVEFAKKVKDLNADFPLV